MYIFSESQKYIDHVLHLTTSGGVGINTIMDHVAHPNLPFGGIGESGMGCYGSKYGIDEFSHRRAVVTRTTRWPKMLNSPIPMPEKGKYPDFLYGVARWAIMGNFSRETKAWIRATFYC